MRKLPKPGGKPLQKLLGCSLLLIVFLGLLYLIAPRQLQRLGDLFAPRRQQINLATAAEGGHYQRIAELMRTEMGRERGQGIRVLETQGSLENLSLLEAGKADFALVQGGLNHEAFQNISAVAHVSWQYVHILVPASSAVKQLRDLDGKNISLGPRLSGNASLGKNILSFFWPDDNIRMAYSNIDEISADFTANKMDAILLVYDFHAPVVDSLLMAGDYRLVDIPEAEAIAMALPGTYPADIIGGMYGSHRNIPEVDTTLRTLKVKTLLVARSNISRFAVERMLQVLYSHGFLKRANLDLNEATGRDVLEVPLHPAAVRFYRRNDPITSDMFEIGSFFLAVSLFLGSALSFMNKRGRERRLDQLREQIVPYFEDLLQASEMLSEVQDVATLEQLLSSMMATQRKAEADWLNGKLDTEHMENLYAIYGIHCSNAFQKMQQLLHERRLQMLLQLEQKGTVSAEEEAEITSEVGAATVRKEKARKRALPVADESAGE